MCTTTPGAGGRPLRTLRTAHVAQVAPMDRIPGRTALLEYKVMEPRANIPPPPGAAPGRRFTTARIHGALEQNTPWHAETTTTKHTPRHSNTISRQARLAGALRGVLGPALRHQTTAFSPQRTPPPNTTAQAWEPRCSVGKGQGPRKRPRPGWRGVTYAIMDDMFRPVAITLLTTMQKRLQLESPE